MHVGLLAGVDHLAAVSGLNALLAGHDGLVLGLVLALHVLEVRLDVSPVGARGGAVVELLLQVVVAVVVLGRGTEGLLIEALVAVTEGEVAVELTLLCVLLRVVPGATSVGHGDGELDRRHNSASQEARDRLHTEEGAGNDGGDDNQHTRRDHLAQGGLRRDGDARVVVGRGHLHALLGEGLLECHALVEVHAGQRRERVVNVLAIDLDGSLYLGLGELASNLEHHRVGSLTHRSHRQSREPVGHHGAEEDRGENDRRQKVDAHDGERLLGGHVGGAAGDEGAEERQRHERSRADGKTLADGRRGVARGIQSIGLVADLGGHFGHLGDAAGVVSDGTVHVDGQAGGQSAEHTQRGVGHTVHARELEREEDDAGDDDDRKDHRLVAEGKTVDDVGGRAGLRRPGHIAHGLV